MKIKICGLKDGENIMELTSLSPDYIGFIYYPPSPRFAIGLSYKYTLKVPEGIKKVGVFVDADKDVIEEYSIIHKLDAIQLHGKETPELCKNLKRLDLEVIKAVRIPQGAGKDFFKSLEKYKEHVDLFLFDTAGDLPGGNGSKFDWKVLENYCLDIPYILSGGIGMEDLETIKKGLPEKCIGIDINSKFEISPGVKDIKKLSEFIKRLRDESTE